MIVITIEYPCMAPACGVTICVRVPLRPAELPAVLNGIQIPPPPAGWTFDRDGAHCPQHEPTRVQPVAIIPPGILKGA